MRTEENRVKLCMTRLDAAITKKQYCLQALDELEKEIRAASKALKTAMKEAEKHDREQP